MTIFLDADGVLVNFVKAACDLWRVDVNDIMARWRPGCYDMSEVLGITEEDFEAKLLEGGERFWSEAPAYDYAVDLFEFCRRLAPTLILTAPTKDPNSASGKIKWFYKWQGAGFNDFMITVHKSQSARHDKLLVDDREKNVEDFIQAGGSAILFPQLSNRRFGEAGDAVNIVKQELTDWAKRQIRCGYTR